MWFVSVVASGSARVWWVLRYWTPRAAELRCQARSLELAIEYQLTRELPVGDPWRDQVESDIEAHPARVPMTAGLVAGSMAAPPRGSRRWRRRQLRAIHRARLLATSPVPRTAVGARRRFRRAFVSVVSVTAALSFGYFVGDTGHQPNPSAGMISAKADITANRGRIPVFSDGSVNPDQKRQIIAYLHQLHPAARN